MKVFTDMIKVLDGQNRDKSDKSIIESVGKEGVLVPLLVYSDPEETGKYVLVAGHRRLASAVHFNLKEVPVEVIPQDQAERARALENLDRKGLHPLDEATEIRTLQSQGYDNGVIAAMLGMERSKVVRRARLNSLIEPVRTKFLDGKIDVDIAEEFSVMSPDDQASVNKRMESCYNLTPKHVRRMYLNSKGLNLDNCSKSLLESKNPRCCIGCTENMASNDLFEGNNVCQSLLCYCEKIKAFMQSEGVTRLWDNGGEYEKNLISALKDSKVKLVSEGNWWYFRESRDDAHTVKKMDLWGNIKWAETPKEKPHTDPEVQKRRREITDRYTAIIKEIESSIGPMLTEFADSWLSKNHKGEPMPDKDERVILAKHIMDQGDWDVNRFLGIKTSADREKILGGADNRRIVALAIMLAAVISGDGDLYVSPTDVNIRLEELHLPAQADLEDLLQLKTSKTRKKMSALKQEADALLKEFKSLEGK